MSLIFHESNHSFQDTLPGVTVSTQSTNQLGNSLSPHWHERMEIWRLRQGQLTVSCEKDVFDLHADDILVINPGQVHSCRVTAVPTCVDCVIFDIHGLMTNRPGEIDQTIRGIAGGSLRFQHIIRNNSHLLSLISQMVECTSDQPGSYMEMAGLLYQFLAILARRYLAADDYAVPRHLQEVSALLEYIHTHFAEPLTLDHLAEKACMSSTYFCRWFKKAVGEPPLSYVTTLRINKAYELLSGGKSVTDACHSVGFSDLNSFNRQFRKRVGVSPSRIKGENKKQ